MPKMWLKIYLTLLVVYISLPSTFSQIDFANSLYTLDAKCSKSQFQCGNGACIIKGLECDGKAVCANEANESNCGIIRSKQHDISRAVAFIIFITVSSLIFYFVVGLIMFRLIEKEHNQEMMKLKSGSSYQFATDTIRASTDSLSYRNSQIKEEDSLESLFSAFNEITNIITERSRRSDQIRINKEKFMRDLYINSKKPSLQSVTRIKRRVSM